MKYKTVEYILKGPVEKTDEELSGVVRDLLAVINYDIEKGRNIWSAVAALNAHTQEQRRRHYAKLDLCDEGQD